MRYENIPHKNSKALLSTDFDEFEIYLVSLDNGRADDFSVHAPYNTNDRISIEFKTTSSEEISLLNAIFHGYNAGCHPSIYFTLEHFDSVFENGIISEIQSDDACVVKYTLVFDTAWTRKSKEIYDTCEPCSA